MDVDDDVPESSPARPNSKRRPRNSDDDTDFSGEGESDGEDYSEGEAPEAVDPRELQEKPDRFKGMHSSPVQGTSSKTLVHSRQTPQKLVSLTAGPKSSTKKNSTTAQKLGKLIQGQQGSVKKSSNLAKKKATPNKSQPVSANSMPESVEGCGGSPQQQRTSANTKYSSGRRSVTKVTVIISKKTAKSATKQNKTKNPRQASIATSRGANSSTQIQAISGGQSKSSRDASAKTSNRPVSRAHDFGPGLVKPLPVLPGPSANCLAANLALDPTNTIAAQPPSTPQAHQTIESSPNDHMTRILLALTGVPQRPENTPTQAQSGLRVTPPPSPHITAPVTLETLENSTADSFNMFLSLREPVPLSTNPQTKNQGIIFSMAPETQALSDQLPNLRRPRKWPNKSSATPVNPPTSPDSAH